MSTFYDQPILNSPYGEPNRHHALDKSELPTDKPPIEGRRSSALLSAHTEVPETTRPAGRAMLSWTSTWISATGLPMTTRNTPPPR